MKRSHLFSWAIVLVASGRLLAHPITESAEIPYSVPGKKKRILSLLEFLRKIIHQLGYRTSLLPRGLKREVLLDKQSLLKPYSHLLSIRKQLRKRNGNSECFWKYCV
uniref:Urotensin 2, alpha n=1 Tax=Cyprinodon variegatus TaxID=28743 RepID=A0A3Q2CE83_CYPVA